MRHTRIAIALATASLALGGCAALGLDESTAGDSATAAEGKQWLVVDAGKATPSPGETTGKAIATPEVSLSLPAPDPSCTKLWPRTEPVMIPVEVTPGAGSLAVEWPTQGLSDYKITAVLQDLVVGAQPEPVWIPVPPGKGCSVSTTISGLIPGEAYIVWLDAPNTGREVDGTRRLYSGRSGVVYPQ
ncbi:hypothetical protein Ait01nite_085780 [Actinoplanes italicus]|uniref:Fibronectin type-III domain-containing protein n=1 Tax=Actinoplanes italicus TaxID=113567 RepID=A0A2T0JWZ6_9ACTN|nr:hypothetical protein [Actinoplanes italicus]PRX12414.1 hypothetical protein CLV67_12871 [Actinoplanes italicus]GIE35533.1 hypothetical protein Ait01nite_085780 [Actinoplanes italicus]